MSDGDIRRGPARVLIVEDSAVLRHLLTRIVETDPRLELAACVDSAEAALRLIPTLRPDVISMDIRLPGMDGLEATRRIMAQHPTPIVVVADAIEDHSLRISMNALRCGALAVVEKPHGLFEGGRFAEVARTIATQLAIMSEVAVIRRRGAATAEPADAPAPGSMPVPRPVPRPIPEESVLALAASTGGPQALSRLLAALPVDFPLPVLLVQHIGAPFVAGFADWLDGLVPMSVGLARDREPLLPGRVHVAPGDRHMVLAGSGSMPHIRLEAGVAVAGQLPSASVLFASMAPLGPRGIGILLTGMGEDGATGLKAMRDAGATTITEHESTAVVYGMPAAAVRLGGSGVSLPLDDIAGHVLALLGRRRSAVH